MLESLFNKVADSGVPLYWKETPAQWFTTEHPDKTTIVELRQGNPLTQYIQHYEELNYPLSYLADGHTRVRRSLDPLETLHLNFKAHNRNFNLRLQRDRSIFAQGLNFEGSDFKPEANYRGHLEGEPLSRVFGFIYDGVFEGRIITGDKQEYHIESAKQYKHLNHTQCHSVIYNAKDVKHPDKHVCGGVHAHTKDWMNKVQHEAAWQNNDTGKGTRHNYIKFENSDGPELHSREKRSAENHHRSKRAFNPDLNECQLYMRADQTFKAWAGSDQRAMYLMTQYVSAVSYLYETTDFDGNGTPENITLKIRRIEVIGECKKGDPASSLECQFAPANIGVEKFLDLASLGDHQTYCLSYVFAHRDFSGGVLGLAWIGDAGSGGICDRKQNFGSNTKTLNTGIVTNLNYGNTMTTTVTEITLAHEIGHNFGSKHDPTSGVCAPGGSQGNYIMYPRATSGANQNNNRFSSCSKNQMWSVLQARSAVCFASRGDPICGNRIREGKEECDCGFTDDDSCRTLDKCCVGAPKNGGGGGCKFSTYAHANTRDPSKICSSSNGFCCDVRDCSPYIDGRLCSQNDSCKAASYCESNSFLCPNATKEVDLTPCNNDENVCLNGECSGSVCLLKVGFDMCQCTDIDDRCKVCCRSENSTCKVHTRIAGKDHIYLPPGTPCNDYNGYCDILNKCRDVDAEGPLSRLKNFLFNSQTFDNILDWMKQYWWACVLIGLGLVLLMAGFIACCSVHTPSSNPNKPPPRPMTLPRSLSRRGTRNRANAPPYDRHDDPKPPSYDTALRDRQGYPNSMEMR